MTKTVDSSEEARAVGFAQMRCWICIRLNFR